MTTTNIRKWGNSQGLYIPVDYLRQLGIKINDSVILNVENDTIVIRRNDDFSAKAMAVKSLREIREKALLKKESEGSDVYGKDAPRDYKKEYKEYLDERYNI